MDPAATVPAASAGASTRAAALEPLDTGGENPYLVPSPVVLRRKMPCQQRKEAPLPWQRDSFVDDPSFWNDDVPAAHTGGSFDPSQLMGRRAAAGSAVLGNRMTLDFLRELDEDGTVPEEDDYFDRTEGGATAGAGSGSGGDASAEYDAVRSVAVASVASAAQPHQPARAPEPPPPRRAAASLTSVASAPQLLGPGRAAGKTPSGKGKRKRRWGILPLRRQRSHSDPGTVNVEDLERFHQQKQQAAAAQALQRPKAASASATGARPKARRGNRLKIGLFGRRQRSFSDPEPMQTRSHGSRGASPGPQGNTPDQVVAWLESRPVPLPPTSALQERPLPRPPAPVPRSTASEAGSARRKMSGFGRQRSAGFARSKAVDHTPDIHIYEDADNSAEEQATHDDDDYENAQEMPVAQQPAQDPGAPHSTYVVMTLNKGEVAALGRAARTNTADHEQATAAAASAAAALASRPPAQAPARAGGANLVLDPSAGRRPGQGRSSCTDEPVLLPNCTASETDTDAASRPESIAPVPSVPYFVLTEPSEPRPRAPSPPAPHDNFQFSLGLSGRQLSAEMGGVQPLRRQSSSSLPDNLDHLELLDETWFHPSVSRQDAERALSGGEDGFFLVRNTSLGTSTLAVSVCFKGKVFHNRITLNDSSQYVYSCDKKRGFDTVVELLNFYTETPPKKRFKLRRYYPRDMMDNSLYS